MHLSIPGCNNTFFKTASVFGSDKNTSISSSLVLCGKKLVMHSHSLLWTIHVYWAQSILAEEHGSFYIPFKHRVLCYSKQQLQHSQSIQLIEMCSSLYITADFRNWNTKFQFMRRYVTISGRRVSSSKKIPSYFEKLCVWYIKVH